LAARATVLESALWAQKRSDPNASRLMDLHNTFTAKRCGESNSIVGQMRAALSGPSRLKITRIDLSVGTVSSSTRSLMFYANERPRGGEGQNMYARGGPTPGKEHNSLESARL